MTKAADWWSLGAILFELLTQKVAIISCNIECGHFLNYRSNNNNHFSTLQSSNQIDFLAQTDRLSVYSHNYAVCLLEKSRLVAE